MTIPSSDQFAFFSETEASPQPLHQNDAYEFFIASTDQFAREPNMRLHQNDAYDFFIASTDQFAREPNMSRYVEADSSNMKEATKTEDGPTAIFCRIGFTRWG